MSKLKIHFSVWCICWVSENKHPFQVVKDRALHSLMKIGRPGCYIPLPETILHDVKKVFVGAHGTIARMLQVSLEDEGVHITY